MATPLFFRNIRLAVLSMAFVLLAGSATLGRATNGEGLQLFMDAQQQAVTLQLPALAPRSGLRLSLLDATGHIIYSKPLNTASGPLVSLPVTNYAAGIYLLIVEGPNGYNIAQRLILK